MKGLHTTYVAVLFLVFTLAATVIGARGCRYYLTSQDERPYHPQYERLKPTGIEGHGFGVVGTLCIVVGVALYSGRKRIGRFRYAGKIRSFLEFHIFLCLTGPMLVLYHTTFKFGGLVAVSFWSMVAVAVSGFVGRYLYLQIPRNIEGTELTLPAVEFFQGVFLLEPQEEFLRGVLGVFVAKAPAFGEFHQVLRVKAVNLSQFKS